jgi:hypothetical protein
MMGVTRVKKVPLYRRKDAGLWQVEDRASQEQDRTKLAGTVVH